MAATLAENQRQRIAERLQQARLVKSWTRQDLEVESGVSRRTIARYEDPLGADPHPHLLKALAEKLEVATWWLWGLDEDWLPTDAGGANGRSS